jgi:hypothetical protein
VKPTASASRRRAVMRSPSTIQAKIEAQTGMV